MKGQSILIIIESRKLALLAGLMAVFLFGASFVATKIALEQVDPLTLVPIRFGLGLMLLWPVQVLREFRLGLPTRQELARTALIGGMGILLNQWFQARAMVSTGAATASWLAALAPAFMVVLAWIFLRERIAAWQWLGIVLAFIGALLVSDADPVATLEGESWFAPALLVASALAWAAFSIFGKAESQRTSPLRTTVLAMTWAFIFSLMLNFLGGSGWDFAGWRLQTWGALIFLGLACTGLAYALYFYALAGAQSALIAALQYLEPLITIGLAFLYLQEKINLNGLIGGILILAGIVLVERTGFG